MRVPARHSLLPLFWLLLLVPSGLYAADENTNPNLILNPGFEEPSVTEDNLPVLGMNSVSP